MADPTRPYPIFRDEGGRSAGTDAQQSALVLESVVIGKLRKFAFINGKKLHIGQSYNGSKLVAIHPGRVVMESKGTRLELSLGNSRTPWLRRYQ